MNPKKSPNYILFLSILISKIYSEEANYAFCDECFEKRDLHSEHCKRFLPKCIYVKEPDYDGIKEIVFIVGAILIFIFGTKFALNILFLNKYQFLKGSIVDFIISKLKLLPKAFNKKHLEKQKTEDLNKEFTIKKFSIRRQTMKRNISKELSLLNKQILV
jgi:hypothetical protein